MEISKVAQGLEFSPIRKFNPIAAEIAAQGVKIYKLNIGQPDIETPSCYFDALKNYNKKVLAYQESQGDSDLLNSINEYFKRDYGVSWDKGEIIVTMGASEGINLLCETLLNAGDQVIMAEPYYSNYTTFINLVGGSISPIATDPEQGYNYANMDALEAAYNDKCKAIVCINPNNPTGFCMTREEMDIIAEFALKHDLWVIADEAYREYVYDGRTAYSFAQLEQLQQNLIVVDSVSKRFSACGARIGYLCSKNKDFMSAVLKICMGRLCVPSVDQVAAAELYKLPNSYFVETKAEYEARRDAAFEVVKTIPGVVCKNPGGAFYMMLDLPVENAEDFLLFMLNEFRDNGETMMFTPAACFYATPGKGLSQIRIAYVLNRDDMKRALELLKLGLEAYNRK